MAPTQSAAKVVNSTDARRTLHRCALKYRGQDIPYAAFDARIGKVGGWLASRGIVLRNELEANA
jgi:hypothetical protein